LSREVVFFFSNNLGGMAMRNSMVLYAAVSKADLQRPSSGFEDVNLSKVPHSEQDHVQIVGRAESDSTNVTTLTA
jgi:hypothetical protein